MAMTDPVADMLTRIRNANTAYHDAVDVPASNLKESIARILQDEGFIRGYRRVEDNKQGMLRLYLKYGEDKERVIHQLQRISKPGRRVYASASELPRVLNGLGIAVISTSKGVLTDKQCRQEHVGGEVICYIW